MSKLFVTSAAERDFTEALCWYAERSLRAAEGFDTQFDRALEAIAADPQRFPLCDERHRYYSLSGYPFQVIYREHADGIVVIAVAHAKRRLGYWHGR